MWDERPLSIELPPKMDFKVVETDPGIKGNSAANMYKSAKLDNGMTVRVPLFIKEGEQITVDTGWELCGENENVALFLKDGDIILTASCQVKLSFSPLAFFSYVLL